jgi:hypothetical protein
MRLGIDFDNTIVCYDGVFHAVASDHGLIDPAVPATKEAVRNDLRRRGHEETWIELQGMVYGPEMVRARPFEGAVESLSALLRRGLELRIISHRTRHPYRGPQHDLHQAARDWLAAQRFFEPISAGGVGFTPDQVTFEVSKLDKLRRIADERCTHFIDDLPELLAEPTFPPGVERILFDPAGRHLGTDLDRVGSWAEIAERFDV